MVAQPETQPEATLPESERITLDPAQKRFFDDDARVIAVLWHRQKGKDFTTAAKAVLSAMETGQSWYIVSLTQRQADATFAKCKDWARYYQARFADLAEAVEVEHEARTEFDEDFDHLFTFRSRELLLPNGGRVVSLPGRSPDALAGLTGNVIFTEFGLFPNGGYDHWRVVFPLSTRGFRVIAISTPRGKETKFYELCADEETFSVHRCDIHQSIAEGFELKDQRGQPTDIETFKALYGDDVGFAREYECKFMGAMASLLPWSQLEAAAAEGAGRRFTLLEARGDQGVMPIDLTMLAGDFRGRPEIGWDVARNGDLSAVWVNDGGDGEGPAHLRALVLMRDCTFAFQRSVVSAAMALSSQAVGAGDSTGLGMDSNETLEARYGDRWTPVNFGGRRKSDLGSGLATAFRDGAQTLPSLERAKFVAADLYAVQRDSAREGVSAGKDGKAPLKLAESQNPLLPESHCDIAYAGALAIHARFRVAQAMPSIGFLDVSAGGAL